MSRAIKFRAWHKAEKKMCEVTLLRPSEGAFLVGVAPEKDQIVELLGKTIIIAAVPNGRYCNWNEFELMGYTGENDKNDKEIYLSDIVEEEIESEYGKGIMKHEVEFHAGAYYPISMQPSDTFKKIGNIYENPELLPELQLLK